MFLLSSHTTKMCYTSDLLHMDFSTEMICIPLLLEVQLAETDKTMVIYQLVTWVMVSGVIMQR